MATRPAVVVTWWLVLPPMSAIGVNAGQGAAARLRDATAAFREVCMQCQWRWAMLMLAQSLSGYVCLFATNM